MPAPPALRPISTLSALVCCLFAFCGAASAQIFVTSPADSGPGTLRQALLDAENIPEATEEIVTIDLQFIQQSVAPARAAIDLTGPLYINRSVYIVAATNLPRPRISDPIGWAMNFTTSRTQVSFILQNLRFEGSKSTVLGGAIHCSPGASSVDLEVLDCEFVNNRSVPLSSAADKDGQGGAIYFVDTLPASPSQLTIKNCLFDNNHARTDPFANTQYSRGAAIYLEGAEVTVEDSQFLNNFSGTTYSGAGGALYIKGNLGVAAIRRCIFRENIATNSMYVIGAFGPSSLVFEPNENSLTFLLEDSTFERNTGSSTLYLRNLTTLSPSSATIRNTTFFKNTARTGSALEMAQNFGNVALTHCTIWNNDHSSFDGSSVEVIGTGNLLTVSRSVIAENYNYQNNQTIGTSPDIQQSMNGSTNLASAGYNFIGDATGHSSAFTATGDRTGTAAAPLIPKLADAGDYGGPTRTCPPLPDSPLVDAIPNAANVLTTDQRGIARPQGFTADIGAVELPRLSYDVWDDQITLAADRDPSDDPDHDGLTNRQEYAFGTDPMVANPAPVRIVQRGDGSLAFEVIRSATIRPAFFSRNSVETSTDLTPGSWLSPTGEIISEPESPGSLDRIRSLYPVGNDPRRFFRVAVE